MLLGIIDTLFFQCLVSLLLKTWCFVIERASAVVTSEPSEAVKE